MKNLKKIFNIKDYPLVIAEVGINHNGNLELAKQIIEAAKDSGADVVKLQTFKAESFCSKSSPYFKIFKKCELTKSDILQLITFSKKIKINIFSTVFDNWSLNVWKNLSPVCYKIASGDITYFPLLKKIALTGKPIIVSTGSSNMQEVENALRTIKEVNEKAVIFVLHCISNYPAKVKEVNLLSMVNIKKKFSVEVGFSDHTNNNISSIAASALGAKIIEKHFTIDKSLNGPDHKLSADPYELKKLVKQVKSAYLSRGKENKIPVEKKKTIVAMRRSIFAAIDIKKGQIFNNKMLSFTRPVVGIEPQNYEKVLNRKAKRNIKKGSPIFLKDLN